MEKSLSSHPLTGKEDSSYRFYRGYRTVLLNNKKVYLKRILQTENNLLPSHSASENAEKVLKILIGFEVNKASFEDNEKLYLKKILQTENNLLPLHSVSEKR